MSHFDDQVKIGLSHIYIQEIRSLSRDDCITNYFCGLYPFSQRACSKHSGNQSGNTDFCCVFSSLLYITIIIDIVQYLQWRVLVFFFKHQQFGLCNNLFMVASKISWTPYINGPLWGESIDYRRVRHTKRPVMRKVYPCQNVMLLTHEDIR